MPNGFQGSIWQGAAQQAGKTKWKCMGFMANWIQNRLSGVFCDWKVATSGIPQGSVLVPCVLVWTQMTIRGTTENVAGDPYVSATCFTREKRFWHQEEKCTLVNWAAKWQNKFSLEFSVIIGFK